MIKYYFVQGMLTEDMMKMKIAELATTNPKGLSLDGFDKFIDYLVRFSNFTHLWKQINSY